MGAIECGPPVKCNFYFINNTNAPLNITKINTSCGCLVANYNHDEIAAGDSALITLHYHSAQRAGATTKSATVHLSDGRMYVLNFRCKGYYSEDLLKYFD